MAISKQKLTPEQIELKKLYQKERKKARDRLYAYNKRHGTSYSAKNLPKIPHTITQSSISILKQAKPSSKLDSAIKKYTKNVAKKKEKEEKKKARQAKQEKIRKERDYHKKVMQEFYKRTKRKHHRQEFIDREVKTLDEIIDKLQRFKPLKTQNEDKKQKDVDLALRIAETAWLQDADKRDKISEYLEAHATRINELLDLIMYDSDRKYTNNVQYALTEFSSIIKGAKLTVKESKEAYDKFEAEYESIDII